MTFGNNINFPFNHCNNNELIDINNSDKYISPETPKSNLPNHTISEHATRVSNLHPPDDDDGQIHSSNLSSCKYYSCLDYQKLISDKPILRI